MTPTNNDTPLAFADFDINSELKSHLLTLGFVNPTPVQTEVLPLLLNGNKDLLALAPTGTGKTLAFGIPLLEQLLKSEKAQSPRALVLAPTRELATQVSDELRKISSFARIRVATIYGGTSYQRQMEQLRGGVDIVVATPGRLIDLMRQKLVNLAEIRTVILDEADKMVSMGFKEDLETILEAVKKGGAPHKTWLFSATMHPGVKSIAKSYMLDSDEINLTTEERVSQHTTQYYISCFGRDRAEIAVRLVQSQPEFYGIIFCQTKQEVDHLGQHLIKTGLLAETIHGDRTQAERERTLIRFKTKKVKVLIATDVAARGLDVQDLTHVVNLSFPFDFETYIHRVGRTGRNGAAGTAVTLISPAERGLLSRLEKKIGVQIAAMPIPSPKEIANSMLNALQADLISHIERDKQMARAKEVISEFSFDEKITGLNPQDLIAALMLKFNSSVFFFKELDAPQNRPGGDRPSGGGRDFRGGGDRYDRGGEREFRGGGGGGFRGRDRGGFRGGGDRFDRGPERNDRGPERSDRGDRGPQRDFRRDRSSGFRPMGVIEPREERSQRDEGPRFDRPAGRDEVRGVSRPFSRRREAGPGAPVASRPPVVRHFADDDNSTGPREEGARATKPRKNLYPKREVSASAPVATEGGMRRRKSISETSDRA